MFSIFIPPIEPCPIPESREEQMIKLLKELKEGWKLTPGIMIPKKPCGKIFVITEPCDD